MSIRLAAHWLLLVMLLVASIEGTVDRASAGHPHGDEPIHVVSASDAHFDITKNADTDHCEHCCHGHVVSLAIIAQDNLAVPVRTGPNIGYDDRIVVLGQAPPTPPPNA